MNIYINIYTYLLIGHCEKEREGRGECVAVNPINLSIYRYIYLSISLSTYLSIYLSICLPPSPSLPLSLDLSIPARRVPSEKVRGSRRARCGWKPNFYIDIYIDIYISIYIYRYVYMYTCIHFMHIPVRRALWERARGSRRARCGWIPPESAWVESPRARFWAGVPELAGWVASTHKPAKSGTDKCMYTYTHTHICIYMYIYICTHTLTRTFWHTRSNAHKRMYALSLSLTHTHTHTHTGQTRDACNFPKCTVISPQPLSLSLSHTHTHTQTQDTRFTPKYQARDKFYFHTSNSISTQKNKNTHTHTHPFFL